jgi:putative phosphoesterase
LRIGVVSDTHLPRFGKRLPAALERDLRDAAVELILHLGDLTGPEVAAWFEAIAPFDAVAGNNDGPDVRRRFGRRKLLDLHGVRVGMVHGDDGAGRGTLLRALGAFAEHEPDVILFGHSHIPYLARHGATLILNPGSPTDRRRQPRATWATLDIDAGHATAALHALDDRG